MFMFWSAFYFLLPYSSTFFTSILGGQIHTLVVLWLRKENRRPDGPQGRNGHSGKELPSFPYRKLNLCHPAHYRSLYRLCCIEQALEYHMVDKIDVALHSLREIQTSSLAMSAATSYIFSEIYLQYVEHTAFVDILIQCKILGYFHYVDGILTVYDKTDTDIVNVVQRFDSILTYLLTYLLHGAESFLRS